MDSNNQLLGKIIQIYRKSMSIEDVAKKINRKLDDVMAWEQGSKLPDTYERVLLSKLYSIPINLLLFDYDTDINAIINCRAVGDFKVLPLEYQFIFASKVDNFFKMIELYENKVKKIEYEDFISLEDHESEVLSNAKDFTEKEKQIIQRKANELRTYYGYESTGYIQNFFEKILDTSLDIVFSKMPDGYSGISFIPNDKQTYFIFINAGDHYCKQTFTLLHEMGHVILNNVKNDSFIEEYVNYFANMFLLPQDEIKEKFSGFNIANIKEYVDTIKKVSSDYEVSYKTIFYSLFHLNLIKQDDLNESLKDFINKIVLTNFNEEYNLNKPSYRYNTLLNNMQKELLEKELITESFVLQMNFGQPFIN